MCMRNGNDSCCYFQGAAADTVHGTWWPSDAWGGSSFSPFALLFWEDMPPAVLVPRDPVLSQEGFVLLGLATPAEGLLSAGCCPMGPLP